MRIYKFPVRKKHLAKSISIGFWFSTGAFLAIFFIISFSFILFENINHNRIYPGIFVAGKNLGGKTHNEAQQLFQKRNELISTKFTFVNDNQEIATVFAKDIDFGYDDRLFATQAFSIGRSKNFLTDSYLIIKGYVNGVFLSSSYKYSQTALINILSLFAQNVEEKSVDAQFKFENGKVITFQPSSEGKSVDWEKLNSEILSHGEEITLTNPKNINIEIPIKIIKPKISTESVNTFGIKELIASGSSHFAHSIPGRIYNISLAAGRIDGALIPPGQIFSFNNTLGDITSFTGYQQAYIIKDGKTVLGDGGGVCQVSTTLFRTVLNAGLTILERNPHSYRVGYYEQDSPPGLDATVYYPGVDFKFKNDTKNYILIQSSIDPAEEKLTFYLYGTKDSRNVSISKPVITNEAPPPSPAFQDDPTLSPGETRQIDFAAWGSKITFYRTVSKDGKTILSDKFVSNYQPWQAVYLRGPQ